MFHLSSVCHKRPEVPLFAGAGVGPGAGPRQAHLCGNTMDNIMIIYKMI